MPPGRRAKLERATAVFGWASMGFAAAAIACLAWRPISDPDRKDLEDLEDLEDLVLIPLLLGIVSIGAALVAVVTGLAFVVRNLGRLRPSVAVPWAGCALLLLAVTAGLVAVARG